MNPRTLSVALAVSLAALLVAGLAAAPAAAQDVPPVELDPAESAAQTRWGIGVAYGVQWYEDENEQEGLGEAGTVNAVQITYRARLTEGSGADWLFELGFEHSESGSPPEVTPGETQRVRTNGVFYRFSRYFGSRFYLGGRIGMSRVRGPEDASGLELVPGLQAGVSLASWLDAGVEVVVADPSGEPGGRPADIRGVVTVSF